MNTYKIVRKYSPSEEAKGKRDYVVKTGLTLEEAKIHCNDPSSRCAGKWFDSFTRE